MQREDVEISCEEDEEPLKAEVLRAPLNPRIPPIERETEMKLLEMLSADVGVQHVSKLVESVDKIELN